MSLGKKQWTTRQLLEWTTGHFKSLGLDHSRLSAEMLLAHILEVERLKLYIDPDRPASDLERAAFRDLVERAEANEPVDYLVEQTPFFSMMLKVSPAVLVPRPSTETLVEHVIQHARRTPGFAGPLIADIGTGSGAIAISVARHSPVAKIFAVDKSTEALQWAGKNRKRLGPIDRVILLTGDMLEPLTEPLDIVLANLPYVPTEEYKVLPDEIRAHEPELAVDGGDDGLDLYRRFAVQLPAHLVDDTYAVLIEIGAGQAPFAEDILLESLGHPENAIVSTHRDLRGIRRIIEVRVGY